MTGNFRGMILSLAPLLKAEQRLTEVLGSAGATLMFEEGKAYAAESLRELRETVPESEPAVLINDVAAWLRTTGWGIFTFDTKRLQDDGTITVLIQEPPNVLAPGRRESHFTDGVVAGVIEAVYRRRASLTHSRYDESARTLELVFQTSA
jgi:hypothetical protein